MKSDKSKYSFIFIVLFVLISGGTFNSCDIPLGMGEPVDFEPPVLTLDPVPTPLYVRDGAKLTGTVTDNVAVDRVIIRNAVTKKTIITDAMPDGRATINGDRWEIVFGFDESMNGEKISLEIVAFDRVGNSGDTSIKNITIIIDKGHPITEDMVIQRSDTRTAFFETYQDLKVLSDNPRGYNQIANVNRYQNGLFTVWGIVTENETRIDIQTLNIYDADLDINEALIKLQRNLDSSYAVPRWLVSEADILAAGEIKKPGYTEDYKNGTNYIYRVAIEAYDKSMNESISIMMEEEGFFLMSYEADVPKGNLDPIVGDIITRGGTIPIEFFDDDSLLWAYTGLLTIEQWNGETHIASGVKINGENDEQKLHFLETRLTQGGVVYNWRYCEDRNKSEPEKSSEPVTELINGRNISERIVYLQTGNTEMDYGEFVVFSIVADKKLAPHTGVGNSDTYKTRTKGRSYRVDVVDENAPLIVLDVEDGCPEENTFPTLTNGEFFTIKGYTLRENGNQLNGVVRLRMAWIPAGKEGGSDHYISQVQAALREGYPDSFTTNSNLDGIQFWDFNFSNIDSHPLNITYNSNVNEEIGTNKYRRQPFERTFSVLGGDGNLVNTKNPPTKTEWQDFHYNGKLENENKLFIIFAECNMGHQVYRQMRLLGNKKPPVLSVYDISGRIADSEINALPNPKIPNLQDPAYGGIVTADYDTALKAFNRRDDVYDILRNTSFNPEGKFSLDINDETIPFQMYTWGSILKYWVRADSNGDLGVKEIRMFDITLDGLPKEIGSNYKPTDNSLSFIEFYPDEAQRVFLIEAEDSLGNIAKMQRTIAVTNAARLEKITTDALSGSYGIGSTIVLQADFSGLIRVSGPTPRLNIRYQTAGGNYVRTDLPAYIDTAGDAASKDTLFLKFNFVVPDNATGRLETMYGYDGTGTNMGGTVDQARPIFLPSNTRIIDVNRGQDAFVPGYINNNAGMPNWTTAKGSLQESKNIALDGVRPTITGVRISGKTAFATSPSTDYYFKDGETIELTIVSDKDIMNSAVPHLTYTVSNIANDQAFTPDGNSFIYSRQGNNTKELVFNLPVSLISDDGRIRTITINTGAGVGKITDRVGNELLHTANLLNQVTNTNINIKKSIPAMPVVTLANTSPPLNLSLNSAASAYNHGFSMTIDSSTASAGLNAWEPTIQYSINGGLNWLAHTAGTPIPATNFVNGTYNLRARYTDRAGNEGYQRHRCTAADNANPNSSTCQTSRNYSCAGTIHIQADFPKLIAVTAEQPTGWFTANAGQNELTFNLAFDEQVRVETANQVTMTLRNRNTSNNGDAVTAPAVIQLQAAAGQNSLRSSIQFNWTGITGKEMREGLYVSEVVISGLRDTYGNTGSATPGTANITGTAPTVISINSCPNLVAGYRVDAVAPTVSTRAPAHQGVGTDNTKITLTFNENVMKGVGTITIRPRGNYSIPPVFEDEGYYLGVDGTTRHATPGTDRTYIPSLGDVYNKLTSVTDRNALAQGTTATNHTSNNGTTYAENGIPFNLLDSTNPSLSRLRLNTRTGQSAGPYIKMTQGLIDGRGYTGNYAATLNANNPSPDTGYMIPDLATKWVLDYQYAINSTTGQVAAIRTALTNAKFRWQELDVVVNTSISGSVVTINLSEPLLRGLEWDVTYPAGTFTDMAGNEAVAVAVNDYNFSSAGVQPPVIRVNRRSYDGKNDNWHSNTNSQQIFNDPTSTGTWTAATTTFENVGWNVTGFNTVHYKVETESQNATVSVGVHQGTAGNNGAATGAWTGNVHAANSGATTTNYTDRAWNAAYNSNATAGTFVLPNIIRRAGTTQSYNVETVNGTREDRSGRGDYAGYRSYNRDFTATELNAISLTEQSNGYQGILSYNALEASKSYIAASAVKNGVTVKGYEGVFRTVVALLYGSNRNNSYIAIEGSNLKNGMPSVAGFPVRDAEETGDNRFVKAFFNADPRAGTITNNGTQGGTQFYWVSTEIVTEWYFLSWGGGQNNNRNGSHQQVGEVDNYMTVGYGDLTFGYNTARYGTGGAVTW